MALVINVEKIGEVPATEYAPFYIQVMSSQMNGEISQLGAMIMFFFYEFPVLS